MQKIANTSVRSLVDIIHQLHDGLIGLNESRQQAYFLFRDVDNKFKRDEFNLAFPVLVEYFLNPAKKVRDFLHEKEITKDTVLASHFFIRKSQLAKMMFLSNWYPKSLLIRSATSLLDFMKKNCKYLPKIMHGQMVGPMMLEIHPTNATCNYRCQMCLWCGGQKQNMSVADFYKTERLLNENDWCKILEEARSLGTKRIIFSGGGETLLSQAKISPVINKANALGFETMIYTNGRTLHDISPPLLDSIMNSNWMRISLHAATPEIYAKLINKPSGASDLELVLNGIKKIIDIKKQRGSKLKIGIGVVLQELNCAETTKIASLSSSLGIDFLDIRSDCIGITEKLSRYQHENMLKNLRELRSNAENFPSGFDISFADDLLIKMDRWKKMEATLPKRCLIPVVRPAIDPFGIIGACDSIGEPYTRSNSPREYVLGQVGNGHSFIDVMCTSANKKLGVNCNFCMPGQISLNTLLEKLIDDSKIGIKPTDQPFCFGKN